MLFNFVYYTNVSQGMDPYNVDDINIKTVEADSMDDAIRIYILGDDIYNTYIYNLIGHAHFLGDLGQNIHTELEIFAERFFAERLYNKFLDDFEDLTETEKEELSGRYKEIIDENLDDIATFINMLSASKFFKIEEIDKILTGSRPKSAIKI